MSYNSIDKIITIISEDWDIDKDILERKYKEKFTTIVRKYPIKKIRICGSCGKSGHNARTCKNKKTKKREKKGTKTCHSCGKNGHNARTCKIKKTEKEYTKTEQNRTIKDYISYSNYMEKIYSYCIDEKDDAYTLISEDFDSLDVPELMTKRHFWTMIYFDQYYSNNILCDYDKYPQDLEYLLKKVKIDDNLAYYCAAIYNPPRGNPKFWEVYVQIDSNKRVTTYGVLGRNCTSSTHIYQSHEDAILSAHKEVVYKKSREYVPIYDFSSIE